MEYSARLWKEVPRRKSVRRYAEFQLHGERMTEVRGFIDSLPRLRPEIPVEMEIVPRGSLGTMFGVDAPHYVLVYAPPTDEGRMEAGFRVQALSLLATGGGVGSCILGMAKPHKEQRVKNGLEWAITLSLGVPREGVYRLPEEFRRKALDKVGEPTVPQGWREAVRLAPSAVNGQPWFLTGDEGAVHLLSQSGRGGVKSLLTGSYLHIDLGIALLHLCLAVEGSGKSWSFTAEAPPLALPKGCGYAGTVVVR